ncbi:MAG: protein kinase, partial [Thermoanaerobaculia bacterium]
MIGKTISQYRVVEKLGDGGMGIVYRAEDRNLRRTVAVKFLSHERVGSDDARQRFIREARAAAALDHPHICTVYEVGTTEQGDLFIVMSCYGGGSLRARLRHGRLGLDEAVDLALQAAEGMAHAHAAGVIHRDIKPENLLFDREGRLKIVDFGLARVESEGSLTRTGVIVGTYAYMSPEQALGERVDARADVWSLGAVLYEMATGRPPFRSGGTSTVIHAVLHKQPDPLGTYLVDAPQGLQDLLDRALAKDAALRYSDAGELVEALRELRGGVARPPAGLPPERAETVVMPPTARPSSRRAGSAPAGARDVAPDGRCPECDQPASPGQRFCGACGAELRTRCAHCGESNPPENRFCGRCGRPVGSTESSSPRATAERRQLTVLFSELAGAISLSERLEPEELRELILDYHSVCEEVVRRHGGQVAQFQGDGVFCTFGYPQAHEDDPRRAVAAGLDLVAAVDALGRSVTGLGEIGLAARVGVHTGVVVTGEDGSDGSKADLALGSTPKVAARLQQVGEPGWVVLSESTRRLTRGFFEIEELGGQSLRGMSQPVPAFRAVGTRRLRSRFEATAALGLTPAVGRGEETERIAELGRRAVSGHGRGVLLAGEAGIGKSRLLHLARAALSDTIGRWWVCAGVESYRRTAYHVAKEAVLELLGVAVDDGPDEIAAALAATLDEAELERREIAPLLRALLGLPPDPEQPLPPLSPMRLKQKTLEALLELPLALARRRPAALVVEDLHWVDFSSREWITALLRRAAESSLLIIMTSRPEGVETWPEQGRPEMVPLDRLSREDSERMIVTLAGGKPLPGDLVRTVLDRTDGVPLFVEELTKTILESGALVEGEGEWTWAPGKAKARAAVPDTLQDSLTARLDRLDEAKSTAQLAAVLGRRFSFERLAAVADLEPSILARRLGELVEAGLVFANGVPPEADYLFKHALVRDAAYQSLLRSERRQLHERLARVLEDRFPEVEEREPELLAEHWEQAQQPVQAVRYLQRAGDGALASWAFVEARGHLDHGLELLERIPASPSRDEIELGLELARGLPLVATTGYTSEEAEANYRRAAELAEGLGRSDVGFGIRYRTWGLHLLRGAVSEARER